MLRRLAGEDPAVNEEWITDKDRFAFAWQSAPDRLTTPLVRNADGELEPASWVEALDVAAAGLRAAQQPDDPRDTAIGVGVLPGGRLTLEDAYAYGKFARVALGTNDVDGRARPHSAEEETFLGHHVAGRTLRRHVRATSSGRPRCCSSASRPRRRRGIAFLRLRNAVVAAARTACSRSPPLASRGLERLSRHAAARRARHRGRGARRASAPTPRAARRPRTLLGTAGAVVLVGERLAGVPGGFSAALRLAQRTGARLAWVPRRVGRAVGRRGRPLPSLLPGGRPVADSAARVDLAAAWGVEHLPAEPGRSTTADPRRRARRAARRPRRRRRSTSPTCPTRRIAREALDRRRRSSSRSRSAHSEVTDRADVVLPVAPPVEKPGTFVTWEGRPRPFPQALASHAMADHRVLDRLADALGVELGLQTLAAVHAELDQLGGWDGARVGAPDVARRRAARGRRRARPCWPPGTSCSTPVACSTASRSSPAPPSGPSPGISAGDRRGGRACADGGRLTVSHRRRARSRCPAVVTDDARPRRVAADERGRQRGVRDALHADAGRRRAPRRRDRDATVARSRA